MLFSGKQLDDMGFPKMCKDNNMTYTTVKMQAEATDAHMKEHHSDFDYDFYYGLCFNSVCSVGDLNEGGSTQLNYFCRIYHRCNFLNRTRQDQPDRVLLGTSRG
jgi:hypothetical protein